MKTFKNQQCVNLAMQPDSLGRSIILTLFLLFIVLNGFGQNMPANPFIRSMYTADPSAHVWADGRLYVYPSHDIAPARGADLMDQYHVFSTSDMVNWTDHGEILRASQVSWGRPEGGFMWAPDCAFKNGTYYFYFPHPSGTDWNTTWKIGVATSSSPASGFTVQGYIPGLESLIDPCVFVDDDGQAYFYYGGGGVCKGGKLKANMMEIDGAMQNMQGLTDFHEATWVHKRNGIYYLSYADNNDVGDAKNRMQYATSTSPLGPWTPRGVYIDATDSYTDHGSIVQFNGQWYAFYHNSMLSGDDWLRSICVDKLFYNTDGTIQKVIQTKGHGTPFGGTARAIPGIIEAEDFDNGGPATAYRDNDVTNSGGQYRPSDGVDIEVCSEGGYNVGWINNKEWMEYTVNVAASGNYTLGLRVATETTPSAISVEFGGVDKTGTMTVPATGGWQTYTTISKTVSLTAGQQIMTVRMKGGAFNFNKITLTGTGVTAPSISSAGTANGTVGASFNYSITASNTPTSYGATGLPSGLSLNTSTGLISGTPTTSGTFNITVSATNSAGTGTKPVTLTITNGTVQNDLNLKMMMGYQGWFLCQGDNSAPNEWRHWFQSLTDPSVAQLNVDLWPDMSEYTKTYATSMNYPNGTNARLFSSHDASTTNLHFKWMKDYNIYGVYLQRFLGEAVNDSRFFQVRNNVLQNVINASAANGRHFSIMYDISGVPDDGTLASKLIADWEYLVNTYNVTNQSSYVKQEGKPVIAIWGIGFRDRGLKPATFQQLINYFHNTAAPQYRAYVVGGVPDSWRTLNNDADTDPAWTAIYHSLDMISPWAVGRYGNTTEADNWKTNKIIPDMTDCNNNGIDYMPVIFPGFSWYNMHDGSANNPINQIPRAGGNFYWRQAYNAVSAGSKYVYVAMFDEVDEGTAMFKVAPTNASAPAGTTMVTLDEDGQSLPSDWYLRLAGETQKMLDGTSPVTPTIPITPGGNAPVITSATTASGTVNTDFSYSITATNSPTSFAASNLPPGLSVNTTTGIISGTPTTAGNYSTTISAINSSGTGTATVSITINNQSVLAIPGTIQAESFCAMSGIQVENTTDTGAGQNVGFIDTGDWMDYCVNVASSGTYNVTIRVASPNTGGQFQFRNGATTLATVNVTTTGGWQTWANVTTTVNLSAGNQTLRFYVSGGGFNVNWMQFAAATSQAPYGGTARNIPGIIQAEDYDTGGEGLAYHDIDAANTGAQYRSDGVDIEACTEGGFNVGWMRNTEWLEYTINVTTAGTYTLQARVASGLAGKTFHVELDGVNISGVITIPNTGGWQTWQTVQVTTPSLTTGQKILKISIDSDDFNLNSLTFATNTVSSPVVTNTALPAGTGGSSYNATITASNGPASFGASGLPSGLTVNTSSGVISGTPTVTGNFNVILSATNSAGTGTKALTLSVYAPAPVLNCPSANATQGSAYSFSQPAYTWTTISYAGSGLPSGLTVNAANGTISGTPTVCGTFNITLNATTSAGITSKTCTLTVNCPGGIPVINNTSLALGGVGNNYSVTIAATNSPTSYNVSNLPLGLSVNTSTGVISGTLTRPGDYSVVLSASNASGTGTKTLTLSVTEPAGVVSALKPSSAITVNGSLSETSWNLSKTLSKNTVGTGNNTTTFGVLWDNSNLYIGVKVVDGNLFSDSSDPWEDDAVEIYIDANNNKAASYDGLDNQIIKNYNKSTVFTKLAISGLQHAWAVSTGGYSIEIAIPFSQLGISAPANGTKIGFDVGYDDDDNGATRDAQAVWNGTVNNYQNTSAFGTIVLSSATAGSPVGRISPSEIIAEQRVNVSYWPNEVIDELHISADGSFEHVAVFDLLGRQYVLQDIHGKKEVTLNLTELANGLHVVKMHGREASYTFRIIKKK